MASTVSNNQIFNELKDVAVAVARIEGRVGQIETSTADLMKVVIKGNGHLPLTERVKKLEEINCAEDIEKAVEAQRATDKKRNDKATKEKWGTRTWAIIAAVLIYLITQSIALANIFEKLAAIKP